MTKFTKSLSDYLNILTSKLGEDDAFTISDATNALERPVSTVRWILWNLADLGKIARIGHGLYSFRYHAPQISTPHLSNLGKKIKTTLEEFGVSFFISGLDIVKGYMIHVPERYPVITFIEQNKIEEVQELLSNQNIDSIIGSKAKDFNKLQYFPSLGDIVILRQTNEFNYSHEGLAEPEKAFVDLYFEITRGSYPLSLAELGRIYLNMKRRGALNLTHLSKISIRRNIHHDIRYILNYKRISTHAFKFSEILKELEKD